MVPGVKVIELASINLPYSFFISVGTFTIPGLIGSDGLSTLFATSIFALTSSIKRVGM